MKKPKLIFKVNQNYTAKVYVGKKWHKKDVIQVDIVGEPKDFTVVLTKNTRNENGVLCTEYDENGELRIAQEKKTYHIKSGDCV